MKPAAPVTIHGIVIKMCFDVVTQFSNKNMTVVRENTNSLPAYSPSVTQTAWLTALMCIACGVWLHHSSLNQEWLIQGHQKTWLPEQFWLFVTQWGDAGQCLLLMLFLFARDGGKLALILKTWILGIPVSVVLKHTLNIPRPLNVLEAEWLQVVGQPPLGGHSMPSGHAMAAGSAAALLFLFMRSERPRLQWVVLLLCALVALSRVSVAAHWPADVITGFGLGGLLVILACHWEKIQPWVLNPNALRTRFGLVALQVLVLYLVWVAPLEGFGMALARGVISAGVLLGVLTLWPRARA
jgi:membrane-associated phospholipid phosphatase